MLSLGSLAFAAPYMLGLLVALPVIWWLLRLLPPAPKLVRFPAIRLLFGLQPKEETPRRLPLWLLILRLLLATALIVALAKPLLNPAAGLEGSGPLLLVIDDGWATAPDWKKRIDQADMLIGRAERAGRSVLVLTTAPLALDEPQPPRGQLRAQDARAYIKALKPKPWAVDRAQALKMFEALKIEGEIFTVWIADGLMDDGARPLVERLQRHGTVEVLMPELDRSAVMLTGTEATATELKVKALRADASAPLRITVNAIDDEARAIARVVIDFAPGAAEASGPLVVPNEVRNRIARLEIEGMQGAGSALLIDERFRRRPVGIVGEGGGATRNQPLLNEIYYLDRALAPFASLTAADVPTLMQQPTAVILLPDSAAPSAGDREQLARWIEAGGLLVRFAGPRLAAANDDALTPVRLRAGDRSLGGVMTWDKPAGLAPFDVKSPFVGLNLPKDVIINQQVLAEPSLDLADRIWARLTDGTPLVTAQKRGNGWLVLVHTSANTEWSNLSLSGLFVDMLQRMVALSRGVAGDKFDGALKPWRTLDGFAKLGQPPVGAQPIAGDAAKDFKPAPITPPGLYGEEGAQQAFNLGGRVGPLKIISGLPGSVLYGKIETGGEIDLVPIVLSLAMALLLIDMLVALWLRGLLAKAVSLRRAAAAIALGVLAATMAPAPDARAQDDMTMKATLETRLAYVVTSNRDVDNISRAGLLGLSQVLRQRTSVEPAEPIGLDLERDELRLFPFIYWPITADQPPLSRQAAAAVDRYLKTGGIILIDTRDAHITGGSVGSGPGTQQLKRLLAGVEIPKLVPMAKDHALTKSFYLLSEFPGRWSGGGVWLEAGDGRINDGVTPLVIGANDFAGAWAVGPRGDALLPVSPGGHQQRELAFRFGVNLVMYALTGNYKDDQVHLPKILERLVR